jgi:kumamolisin
MSVVSDRVVYLAGTNFPNKPPRMMKTTDGGATWAAWDMRPWASILIDTYFTTPDRGWVVGGKTDDPVPTRDNVQAVVLFTEDGGRKWVNRAAALLPLLPKGEWGWKIQFLNDRVGFVSLENFTAGAVLKTTDGGQTWVRIPVTDPQQNANLEGVGFVDEDHGWVGGWGDKDFQRLSTSETTDGGRTWRDANVVGKALNRFRFFGDPVTVGYASGQTVYKYTSQPAARSPSAGTSLLTDNQPRRVSGLFRLPLTVPAGTNRLAVRVWDRFGDHVATPLDEVRPAAGPRTIEWNLGRRDPGYFIVRVTADDTSESQLIHYGPDNSACTSPALPTGVGHMVSPSHVVVPGTQRLLLPGSKLLGAASPHDKIEVTLELRHKTPLPPLPDRPKAPLSRESFAQTYGASDADIAKVKDVLKQYGLDFVGSDPAARTVEIAGTIAALEQAFDVRLFNYAHEHGNYRGRSGAVHVPADLSGIVVDVSGLDDRPVVRRRRQIRRLPLVTAGDSAVSGFLPSDLAKLYDFPDGTGEGQCIGILEFGGQIEPDALQLFCTTAGIDLPNVIQVDVSGPVQDPSLEAGVEVMLDIEVVSGICPKAKIPVYFGKKFDERSWKLTIAKAIHDNQNKPSVLSISWGATEEDPAFSQGAIDRVNDRFQEAAMMGITVCVSAGDDGSADQTDIGEPGAGIDGRAHVDFPASSEFVLGVGGTNLRAQAGQVTETVWKDGNGRRFFRGGTGTGGATGGGVSAHFARPAFQSAITIAPINPGAIAGRVVPDVAAHAQSDSVNTGYFIAFIDPDSEQLASGPVGGTSAAAPLWAALIVRINAILLAEKGPGKQAGYLTPVLYQLGAAGKPIGSAVCKDITTGDNISAAVGGFRSGPGYDAVTGWGSPIGTKLLDALRAIV